MPAPHERQRRQRILRWCGHLAACRSPWPRWAASTARGIACFARLATANATARSGHTSLTTAVSVAALRISLLLLVATLTLGCRPEETIRSYTVPKTPSSANATFTASRDGAAPADAAAPSHRMLALIAPSDRQVWFLKLVGEIKLVDPQADIIKAFLASVKIVGDRPTWQLPGDWTESPPSRMRLATINVAEGLEISVIGLPRTGDWQAQLLDNVNRWRGQLGLPPTGTSALAGFTEPVDDLQDAVIVDLRGAFTNSMTPPFAGGGAPFAGNVSPPRASSPPVAPKLSPPDQLLSTPPSSWVDVGASSFRKANLKTGENANAASVRAMNFAAFGQMGDPLANVNRWRGQIGLPPIGPAEVTELAESVTIAGEPALLFDLVPEQKETQTPDVDPPLAMTAAMQKRGEQVWFFLISGPAETVVAERTNFDAWLASVRFGKEEPNIESKEPTNGDR